MSGLASAGRPRRPLEPEVKARMRKADLITGVVFLLFSAFAFAHLIPSQIVSSIPIDESTPAVLRPEFFPQFTMSLFALTCVLMMASALKDNSGARVWSEGAKSSLAKVCAVFCLTLLYVQALKLVGFAWASPVFMAAVIVLLGVRDWRLIGATAVLFPLFLAQFFWYSFQIILPEGSLFP